MQVKMPIGIEDFKKLRDDQYYFVDKTDFIRQLIDKHSAVTLITRPRRFGKTLTLSMLEYFFSAEKEVVSRDLFSGLKIEKAGAGYMAHRGKYPVLFLTLKEIKNPAWKDWPRMLKFIQLYLSQLFDRYRYLNDCPRISKTKKQIFQQVLEKKANEDEMAISLLVLTEMMHAYYQKPVILLLDEYDVPIQQAWESGYYTGCIGFMRQFLGAALKTNPNLDFAVLTGVLRVAKESIFSGLNNFKTCSVLDETYSDVLGFTPEEVELMFTDLNIREKLPEAQFWYDGYRIGGQEIYNPWSVINYVDNNCRPKAYWVRTSGNGILRFLLKGAETLQISMVQQLLQGKAVNVTLNDSIIYPEIGKKQAALFTILLTTGYLTVVRVISEENNRYSLRIPNNEIRKLYSTEILSSMTEEDSRDPFDNLFEFLLDGNAEYFSMQLQQILTQFVSIYDAANKESFYHGFMLGITAMFLGRNYVIESNRESGFGRFDIAIFPRDTNNAGVIMEFKVASAESELASKAAEALQQIEERQYITEFSKCNIKDVWKYGIAFCGKKICVAN